MHVHAAVVRGLALVALVGCQGGEEDPTSRPGKTTPTEATAHTGTDTSTTAPPLEWPYGVPKLDGEEWLPGEEAGLVVEGVPPGSEVVFLMSETGLAKTECPNPDENGCPILVDPVQIGSAIATDDEQAQMRTPVDDYGLEPRVLYFQAEVTEPVNGFFTRSTAIQRHVNIPAPESRARIVDVTTAVGLSGIFTTGNSHTGGIAWPDINGDHIPDLFIANGGGVQHRLFRNNGDGTFFDLTDRIAKPDVSHETAAVHFADIDNDGDVDLLAIVDSAVPMNSETLQPREGGPNLLYVNQGDGTFTEEALERGLVDPRGWRTITAAFADFNSDGWIDVHLGTWALNQPAPGRDGLLLFNDGTGHFVDSGQVLGYGRDVLTTLAGDFDQDGWADLYLGNAHDNIGYHGSLPQSDDVIYKNVDGTMVDIIPDNPGVGDDAWAAMGIEIGDIDNDGDFDLYVTDRWPIDDPLPRGNPLYLQNDDGSFTDNVCDLHGVCTPYIGWPALMVDFDRDGWLDLYVGTSKSWEQDLIYMNDRTGRFESHWVPAMSKSPVRGGAQADFDGDGDVEFAVWQYNDDFRLFNNVSEDTNTWLELRLQSTTGNPLGIGAVVTVTTADGASWIRRVSGGDSAHSQSSDILHFGMGEREGPVDVEILWPGGEVQTVDDVPVNGFYLISREQGLLPQEILAGSAVYSDADDEIEITVKLRYGGRRAVRSPGGPLTFVPSLGVHRGVFEALTYVDTIPLTNTSYGDEMEIAVDFATR